MAKRILLLLLAVTMCVVCVISAVVIAASNTDEFSITLQIDNPIMTVNGQEK
ncbi:MAG: hypothetical protein Q4G33_15285 [bacterium]|nr:hypothetical protein [bacterium]